MHFREYFPVTDVTLNYVSQIKKIASSKAIKQKKADIFCMIICKNVYQNTGKEWFKHFNKVKVK